MGWEGYKEQHKLHIYTSQTGLKNGLCVCSLLFFLNHYEHNPSQKQNTSLNCPKVKPQKLTDSFPGFLQINVSTRLHAPRHLIKLLDFIFFHTAGKKNLPLAESPSSLDLNLCLTGFLCTQTLNCLGAHKSRQIWLPDDRSCSSLFP